MVRLRPSHTPVRARPDSWSPSSWVGLERPELLVDVSTPVMELVATAVTHARTTIGLSVRSAGAGVRVEVPDGVAPHPAVGAGGALSATSGRGLILVH